MMKKLMVVLALAGFAGIAQADLIARWDNDLLGGINAGPIAANNLGVDIANAELGRGPGGTASTYTNTFGMRNAHSTELQHAVTSNRYLTMNMEADTGFMFTLTNVFVRLQAQNATDYAVNFTLFSGATGYDVGNELVTWTVGGTGNNADWLGQVRQFDLSGVTALQDITSAEFRLYAWGQVGAFTQVGIGRASQVNGTDDLVFTGTIAVVPEPGTLGLMGLGVFGMALARRRFC